MDPSVALCAAWGLAAGGLAYVLVAWIGRPRREDLSYFELQRRVRLRKASAVYRWCEPIIDDLTPLCAVDPEIAARSKREFKQAGREDWEPAEVRAALIVEGAAFSGGFGILLGLIAHPVVGLFACIIGTTLYVTMQLNQIGSVSRVRALQRRRRLPFAVDLLALMMEAGATFLEAVATVVRENQEHPLADELQTMLGAIQQGVTRSEALRDLDRRLDDETAHEMITAILHGEELGTPLAQILRSQSDQMRLKRSQWAEKAIAESQVQMSFPGLLIMIACMLVIIMPFLLRATSVSF